MKLSTYIERLQKLLTEHGDLNLIYLKDDEGNGYNTVDYHPSVMRYGEYERQAYTLDEANGEGEFDRTYLPKVVCVNYYGNNVCNRTRKIITLIKEI